VAEVSAKDVFYKVVDYVSKLDEVNIQNVDSEDLMLFFTRGTVFGTILVTPYPQVEEVILIVIRIPVVINAKNFDPDLLRDLLRKTYDTVYGGFGLSDEDNNIWLCYTLLGNNIDIDQLNVALTLLTAFADEVDEELCEKAKGERGTDFLKRIQSEE